MNYPLGDFLIRIKNASLVKRKEVELKGTKLIKAVAELLKKEGYLAGIEKEGEKLRVRIAYRKKEPVILDVRLVSKPGLRVYMSVDELGRVKGPSILIISTNKGVMTDKDAVKKGLGGEVIAEVT